MNKVSKATNASQTIPIVDNSQPIVQRVPKIDAILSNTTNTTTATNNNYNNPFNSYSVPISTNAAANSSSSSIQANSVKKQDSLLDNESIDLISFNSSSSINKPGQQTSVESKALVTLPCNNGPSNGLTSLIQSPIEDRNKKSSVSAQSSSTHTVPQHHHSTTSLINSIGLFDNYDERSVDSRALINNQSTPSSQLPKQSEHVKSISLSKTDLQKKSQPVLLLEHRQSSSSGNSTNNSATNKLPTRNYSLRNPTTSSSSSQNTTTPNPFNFASPLTGTSATTRNVNSIASKAQASASNVAAAFSAFTQKASSVISSSNKDKEKESSASINSNASYTNNGNKKNKSDLNSKSSSNTSIFSSSSILDLFR